MDQYLVHDNGKQGRAMHALVIGVGDYPHLLGGDGERTTKHQGMGQLSSPPISARNFSDWLINKFNNPKHPRHTVSMLLSENTPSPYTHPHSGEQIDVKLANFENVKSAIYEWVSRGDDHEDDLLIFYFCGHGMSNGQSMVILPLDFGVNTHNAYTHAIDFLGLYDGAASYSAKNQWFFIDACRSTSDALGRNRGQSLLDEGGRTAAGVRNAPTFFATLPGEDAYGLPDEPSVFTSSLIKCLNNYAASDDNGENDWRVGTFDLAKALEHIMNEMQIDVDELLQVPHSANLAKSYEFHHLDETPEANLYISVNPSHWFEQSSFTITSLDDPGYVKSKPPGPGEVWKISVRTGDYTILASIPGETEFHGEITQRARPIFRNITVNVP